jgi:hypothetical protein
MNFLTSCTDFVDSDWVRVIEGWSGLVVAIAVLCVLKTAQNAETSFSSPSLLRSDTGIARSVRMVAQSSRPATNSKLSPSLKPSVPTCICRRADWPFPLLLCNGFTVFVDPKRPNLRLRNALPAPAAAVIGRLVRAPVRPAIRRFVHALALPCEPSSPSPNRRVSLSSLSLSLDCPRVEANKSNLGVLRSTEKIGQSAFLASPRASVSSNSALRNSFQAACPNCVT